MKTIRLISASLAMILGLPLPAMAAGYLIINPAEQMSNPADRIYNPATRINNPATNIYNPATRLNNPNPISPPSQATPQPVAPEEAISAAPAAPVFEQPPPKVKTRPVVPLKYYGYKSVAEYIIAAKKAFDQDDYMEFLAITEDALRRIGAGTITASKQAKQKLDRYNEFGYGLLEGDGE